MSSEIEVGWTDISGWPGYQVHPSGDVRSTRKTLKPLRSHGYSSVSLGKKSRFLVHRIVAETFIPNPEGKPTVNHKDGNKRHNVVENLEWATIKENIHHARDVLACYHGERNSAAKLTRDVVDEIRAVRSYGATYQAIVDAYNVAYTTVGNIVRGNTWRLV